MDKELILSPSPCSLSQCILCIKRDSIVASSYLHHCLLSCSFLLEMKKTIPNLLPKTLPQVIHDNLSFPSKLKHHHAVVEREWQILWCLNLLHHQATLASRILWLTQINLLLPPHQNNKTWTTLISLPPNRKNHQDSHNNLVRMMFWAGLNRIKVTSNSLQWMKWQGLACKSSGHLCQLSLRLSLRATSSMMVSCNRGSNNDKMTSTIYRRCMIHRLKTYRWCSHKIKTFKIVSQNLMSNIKTYSNKLIIRASN